MGLLKKGDKNKADKKEKKENKGKKDKERGNDEAPEGESAESGAAAPELVPFKTVFLSVFACLIFMSTFIGLGVFAGRAFAKLPAPSDEGGAGFVSGAVQRFSAYLPFGAEKEQAEETPVVEASYAVPDFSWLYAEQKQVFPEDFFVNRTGGYVGYGGDGADGGNASSEDMDARGQPERGLDADVQ